MTSPAIWISALLLASACGAPPHPGVPLRWDATGHVVVPTSVDGSAPVDFIFDTGADDTVVFAWLATRLHLPAAGSGEVSGATGSSDVALSRVASLAVDGHTIRDVTALTLPDRADAPQLGGVVGFDVMAGQLAVLDLGCGTAALVPVTSAPAVVGDRAQLVTAGGIPDGRQLTLPVTIDGVTGVAILDSGNRATIINTAFAVAAGRDPASSAFHDTDPVRGASRQGVTARVGVVGTVAFAGVVRRDATARVADIPAFDGMGLSHVPAMLLGLDLLRGTRLSVDVSARRFWLAPSRCGATTRPASPPAS
jgi:predicted aspartyl protease|nr:retroviral-like aspartic protease family protein [Kofleriaceae bacterium]